MTRDWILLFAVPSRSLCEAEPWFSVTTEKDIIRTGKPGRKWVDREIHECLFPEQKIRAHALESCWQQAEVDAWVI
ncbi:MAG: hypothetical protein CMJ62_02230 [Planctomycetaceae bacterium]|nr:hypothetical protein [Planctomycetaceae bacterium]